jgi:hypothetical protein
MATIYPNTPSNETPDSELKVRSALIQIPNLIVFHSIEWQSKRNGRQSDGECDFVVLIPTKGILLLEVKGGGVHLNEGKWHTINRHGIVATIKNPFEQAMASKHALLAYFKATIPKLSSIPIFHAVCFPDITVPPNSPLAMDSPRQIILDRGDLDYLQDGLERVAKHWEAAYRALPEEIVEVTNLLAPTITIKRKLKDDLADASQSLVTLTSQQVDRLWSLNKCKKAIIIGGAGTGKTMLAVEKARRVSRNGFSTLLVCYNAPLCEFLSKEVSDTKIEVQTYHSLVARELKKAKMKIPIPYSQQWFETDSPYSLLSAIESNGTRFDAILIDEAQDFGMEWIDSMKAMLTDTSSLFYLFADSHQDLYTRGWVFPKDLPEFVLDTNCRNTNQIASKVCKVFSDEIRCTGIVGPEPVFHEVPRQDQFSTRIARLLETLIYEGELKPDQIIVLSDSIDIIEELRRMQIDEHMLTDLNGIGIPIETVYRFKGLEREVVILALTNNCLERDFKALAYVGMSRAKGGLHVFGSSILKSAIGWT